MRIGVNGQSVSHWESLSQLAWVRVNCGIETLVDTNDYPTIWGFSQKEFCPWWLTKRILQKSIRVWFLSSAAKRKRALYSHSRWPHWRIVVTMTTPESTGVEPNKRSRVSELSIFHLFHECQLRQWNVRFAQFQRNLSIKIKIYFFL
jgi:hypothetical protein